MPLYIRRRIKAKAPVPLISLMVMIGYGIVLLGLVFTATELVWAPSMPTIIAFVSYGMGSSCLIFVMMLGQFLKAEEVRSS